MKPTETTTPLQLTEAELRMIELKRQQDAIDEKKKVAYTIEFEKMKVRMADEMKKSAATAQARKDHADRLAGEMNTLVAGGNAYKVEGKLTEKQGFIWMEEDGSYTTYKSSYDEQKGAVYVLAHTETVSEWTGVKITFTPTNKKISVNPQGEMFEGYGEYGRAITKPETMNKKCQDVVAKIKANTEREDSRLQEAKKIEELAAIKYPTATITTTKEHRSNGSHGKYYRTWEEYTVTADFKNGIKATLGYSEEKGLVINGVASDFDAETRLEMFLAKKNEAK